MLGFKYSFCVKEGKHSFRREKRVAKGRQIQEKWCVSTYRCNFWYNYTASSASYLGKVEAE